MRTFIATAAVLYLATCTALAAPRVRHKASRTTAVTKTASHHAGAMGSRRDVREGMDSKRATAIQTALIKQGYLTGEPTGVWDAQSNAAMQKLQADNGWQTKITPDSRALIKLGLGPESTSASSAAPATVASIQ